MSHTRTQEEINRSVVDILDQIVQEIRRIRAEKSISNLEGIHQEVRKLVAYLRQTESNTVAPIDIR